jgi:FkbM family methyltransferase
MSSLLGTPEYSVLRGECEALAATPTPKLSLSRPIWIFGAGHFGQDLCKVLLAKNFNVLGFIETQPRIKELLGLPVRSWQQLSDSDRLAQLAVGIYNRGMPLDGLAALAHEAGFRDLMMPWDSYGQFDVQLGWRYWLGRRDQLIGQLDSIEATHAQLSDATSQACLRDIVRFRLGLNHSYGGFRHEEPQYFNQLTLTADTKKPIRFVDGGAYNGDTLLALADLCPIERAYLFEPDAENFKALQRNLRNQAIAAHCLPVALSDGYQILSFNAGVGEAGMISVNGTVHIAAMALDDFLHNQAIDFIKLDVEGGEVAALNGAARLIGRSRPVLAISLYHRPQDLWEIPELLRKLCHDYRFYLRQHYFNSFETVLYAVPH